MIVMGKSASEILESLAKTLESDAEQREELVNSIKVSLCRSVCRVWKTHSIPMDGIWFRRLCTERERERERDVAHIINSWWTSCSVRE